MRIHFVNPSDIAFGTAVITPRWLYVLAAATPAEYGTPNIVDETLEPFAIETVAPGDVVGIGIHTANALRGYEIGRRVRERGGIVVFGGIHSTLFPDEAREHGHAHAVVKGDGDLVLATAAWDGAFLCGSVGRAWLAIADVAAFRSAFESKGPMRDRMAQVPTFLISQPEPALMGLTHAAAAAG